MLKAEMDLFNLYSVAKSPLYPLPSHPTCLSWKPPPLPFFKLNVAVCFCDDLKSCGMRFLLRDFLGKCVTASADRIPLVHGLEAQLYAIVWNKELQKYIKLECNHGLAISVCQQPQIDSMNCPDLVSEVKRLSSLFCACELSIIPNSSSPDIELGCEES